MAKAGYIRAKPHLAPIRSIGLRPAPSSGSLVEPPAVDVRIEVGQLDCNRGVKDDIDGEGQLLVFAGKPVLEPAGLHGSATDAAVREVRAAIGVRVI